MACITTRMRKRWPSSRRVGKTVLTKPAMEAHRASVTRGLDREHSIKAVVREWHGEKVALDDLCEVLEACLHATLPSPAPLSHSTRHPSDTYYHAQ